MNRDLQLLTDALAFIRERSAIITGHVIKARSQSAIPTEMRRRHLDAAISNARQIVDQLVTARTALGWQRKDDAA